MTTQQNQEPLFTTQGIIGGITSGLDLWNAHRQMGQANQQLGNIANLNQQQWNNMGGTRNLLLSQIADRAPTQDAYQGETAYLSSRLPIFGNNFDAAAGNASSLADLMRNIGARYQQEDDYLKAGIGNRINNLDANLMQMMSQWGPTTIASHEDISNRANQIYDANRSALMDVIGRVASESTARNLGTGMDISTADEDMQRQIVNQYAPLLMQARVQSYDDAANHFQNQINTEFLGRNKSLEEMLASQTPGLDRFMQMYRPRDAELGSTQAAAELERGIASLFGDQFARATQGMGTLAGANSQSNNDLTNLLQLLVNLDRGMYSDSAAMLGQARQDYSQANAGVQGGINNLLSNPIVGGLIGRGADWIGNQIGGLFGGGSSSSAPTSGWGSWAGTSAYSDTGLG